MRLSFETTAESHAVVRMCVGQDFVQCLHPTKPIRSRVWKSTVTKLSTKDGTGMEPLHFHPSLPLPLTSAHYLLVLLLLYDFAMSGMLQKWDHEVVSLSELAFSTWLHFLEIHQTIDYIERHFVVVVELQSMAQVFYSCASLYLRKVLTEPYVITSKIALSVDTTFHFSEREAMSVTTGPRVFAYLKKWISCFVNARPF